MNVHVTKTIPIEFKWVVDAYQKVKQGGKAVGIDGESWTDFDKKAEQHCYLIWNRLSSGSYHPQAVRRVEIPKKDGTLRKLGIPTLKDRIAQQVVKDYMEKRIDEKFHKDSYGYRPKKSAHAALKAIQKNCQEFDWVIDMDISKFFDEIDHELMLKAVSHILPDTSWVNLYVKRWLEMPVVEPTGETLTHQGKGTPQGGVISPILANLYLHYTLDLWLNKHYPHIRFVRYADDVVIHCRTEEEAKRLLESIRERLSEAKLSIKESKTKIAYCKDYRRRLEYEHVKFEFLGFSFQPITLKSTYKEGTYYIGFGGKPSSGNEQRITQIIKDSKLFSNTTISLKSIADKLNEKLQGWINYYCLFTKHGLNKVWYILECRILKWIGKKYKTGIYKSLAKLKVIKQSTPKLFYHWELGIRRSYQK